MQASINTIYGAPEVLKVLKTERPVPQNHEVLIRVHAATVNRTDCAMLRAKPFIMRFFTGLFNPKNHILGTDFAGVVERVGKDVTSFKPGDKVFGFEDTGLSSHAEFMCINQDKAIAIMPDNLSFEEAAASLEGSHYALNMINKVDHLKDKNVLINGATGAIGSAAVQLSKFYGANITAVCNTKNIELVKSLGAETIIDFSQEDFTKIDTKYHFIFDAVGKNSFGKCKPLLYPGGVYISSELGHMWQNLIFAIFPPLTGDKKVIFPIPKDCKKSLLLIKKLIEEGKYKAVIDSVYPLKDIANAFRYVEKGQKTGNVVIKIIEG
jgi:NADPH:quinone reductase-like Zn-dependent oxidoreductase